MSSTTLAQKIVDQAKQIGLLQLQSNYLIRELYKLKSDHDIFIKNPAIAAQVKGAVDEEDRLLKKLDERAG